MSCLPEGYREYTPASALRPYVACYWTYVASPPVDRVVQRVLPDGCMDIVFDAFLAAFSEGVVVGTMTRPLLFRSAGPARMVAVRFRPGGATSFLRCSAAEHTDARTELSAMWPDAHCVARQIRAATRAERPVQRLESVLLSRLADAPPVDCRVREAVSLFGQRQCSVETVAAAVDVSRQHLVRLFRRHVGVGPKTFARVVRMRRLLARIRKIADATWTTAALNAGYYDQAHMIAECRALTGLTPTELAQR